MVVYLKRLIQKMVILLHFMADSYTCHSRS